MIFLFKKYQKNIILIFRCQEEFEKIRWKTYPRPPGGVHRKKASSRGRLTPNTRPGRTQGAQASRPVNRGRPRHSSRAASRRVKRAGRGLPPEKSREIGQLRKTKGPERGPQCGQQTGREREGMHIDSPYEG